MIDVVVLILLILAFVLFLLAAFNVPARWNLIAAGLASWVLTVIIALVQSGNFQ
jgi:hypothetical protein